MGCIVYSHTYSCRVHIQSKRYSSATVYHECNQHKDHSSALSYHVGMSCNIDSPSLPFHVGMGCKLYNDIYSFYVHTTVPSPRSLGDFCSMSRAMIGQWETQGYKKINNLLELSSVKLFTLLYISPEHAILTATLHLAMLTGVA